MDRFQHLYRAPISQLMVYNHGYTLLQPQLLPQPNNRKPRRMGRDNPGTSLDVWWEHLLSCGHNHCYTVPGQVIYLAQLWDFIFLDYIVFSFLNHPILYLFPIYCRGDHKMKLAIVDIDGNLWGLSWLSLGVCRDIEWRIRVHIPIDWFGSPFFNLHGSGLRILIRTSNFWAAAIFSWGD